MNDAIITSLQGAGGLCFLCSGNALRSPFAELFARHLGCPLPVSSAATTYRNATLFAEASSALAQRGVQGAAWSSFRSRHLDDLLREQALPEDWLVVGMTVQHLADARLRLPKQGMVLLGDCAGLGEIADPYMDDISYGAAFGQIERCVRLLVEGLLSK